MQTDTHRKRRRPVWTFAALLAAGALFGNCETNRAREVATVGSR